MEIGVISKSSVASVVSVVLLAGCDTESPQANPFEETPVAFASGSTFTFFSDDAGLWESSDPSVARITETDARRVVVRFEGQGTTVLDFFPSARGSASATTSLRSVPAAAARVSSEEPLDGTRVLVGGRVAATMVYLDTDQQPLAGAGLLAEPESTELSSHQSLQVDTFNISPTLAGPHEVALEVQGLTDTVLAFDAVSEDDVVITLAVDTSGKRCEVVATVTDAAGVPVVGWSSRLQWDGDPTQFGSRWLRCREAGDSVTANIGATTATLVF